MKSPVVLSSLLDSEILEFALRGEIEGLTVTSLTADSRLVSKGSLFFAVKGEKLDGSKFIPQAVSQGASVIVIEGSDSYESVKALAPNTPVIAVSDMRLAISSMASRFYDSPSEKMCCIGVTGTNGKTSVSWLTAQALSIITNAPSGKIGTLGNKLIIEAEVFDRPGLCQTTSPDPLELHGYLAKCVDEGARSVVMEVSSHALVQKRMHSVEFDACIFTNLSRDHLDYHHTFEAYGDAKALLFTEVLQKSHKKDTFSVINIDDSFGSELYKKLVNKPGTKVLSYSTKNIHADVSVHEVITQTHGTEVTFRLGKQAARAQCKLIGDYNVSNLTAVVTLLHGFGYSAMQIAYAIAKLTPVPGRLELVADSHPAVFVDYAHTPDGLINAQQSLRKLVKGRMITVFGCGGDRDRGKRPEMGKAVAQLSDVLIVTSDNPRTEDPNRIISDILPGIEEVLKEKQVEYLVVPNRREAIFKAVEIASSTDTILIAGKGHEDYQEVHGVRHPFSDQVISREALGITN